MLTVTTFARRVYCRVDRGKTVAVYHDLVKLGNGRFAITNPLAPGDRADFIRELLSEAEALQRLRHWEHWERNKSDGSSSQIWKDGRRWLTEAAKEG